MPQIIDPRQGVQRTRNLMTKLAAKAMARKGYKSKVGTFGKVAAGGARPRNLRPNRGPGSGLARGAARPGGFGTFLDGLAPGKGQPPPSYLNTAPVAAPVPPPMPDITQLGTAPEEWSAENPMPGWMGTNPNPLAGTPDPTPGFGLPDGIVPENYNPNPDPGMSIWGVPLDQSAPSGPITAPGGLIPLGSGVYYDPVTGQTFGGRGTNREV